MATKKKVKVAPMEAFFAKKAAVPEITKEERTTREAWLVQLVDKHMRQLFADCGAKIPQRLRVSCGWPSSRALGTANRSIGQCWSPKASSDDTTEIFLSPFLSDALEVGAVLAHELVHAAVGVEHGHGQPFRKLALQVGLEGKMTATTAGPVLADFIRKATAAVGAYPHATLDMTQRKKQGTRLLKVVCQNTDCDFLAEENKPYSVRMSASVFDAGAPKCGCCNKKMDCEITGEDE